jgi:hypothetical protein
MKLILNDCGKHWGKGGRCAKCSSGCVTPSKARQQNLAAALEPLPDAQERAIQAAARWHSRAALGLPPHL